jgi:pyruvate dehydrogenase E2 component (dihydrolipoyllysine-residue acetyltransferase)
MPSLGADMEDGTLVEWRIGPGTHVHRGDVVALVETQKGIIDVESFEEGIVERLSVPPGTRVPVGTPLALLEGQPTIAAAGATAPVTAEAAHVTTGAAHTTAEAAARASPPFELAPTPSARLRGAEPAVAPVAPGAARGARLKRVSPAARARAAVLGIDLADVQGSGPQGVVTLQDVEHIAAPKVQPAGAEARPAAALPAQATASARAGMRTAIAAAMSRSKREIPHYYLQLSMDFRPTASWLEAFNASRPVPERVLTAVLLLKAVARAAAEKPGFNGYFGAGGFEPAASVHLGVAIALRGGGLVAPAILEADRKPITTIMRELQDLVGRVRAGHMRSSEISSATLTVTSLGDEGVDTLYPIIYPPQVAIVGFGSVIERPWIVDGQLRPRPVLSLTLAADHRVTDGRQGAQFLARVRDWLSKPGEL